MITVSVYEGVEYPQEAQICAEALQKWKNGGSLPGYFGSEGSWEENKRLCDSFVFKVHIKTQKEGPWPPKTPQAARKSNSYLVYAKHWLEQDKWQIISIMTPNAHEMARTSFLGELERRAEHFQNSNP